MFQVVDRPIVIARQNEDHDLPLETVLATDNDLVVRLQGGQPLLGGHVAELVERIEFEEQPRIQIATGQGLFVAADSASHIVFHPVIGPAEVAMHGCQGWIDRP